MGTPSHLGHMDRVAATMPSEAHAGAAQEAPDIGQWEGHDVPLVRPSSCNVNGGIPSSRRCLPTYLDTTKYRMPRTVSLIVQLTGTRWWVGEGGLQTLDVEGCRSPPPPPLATETNCNEICCGFKQ